METESKRSYVCGVLTVSDKGARGERQDTSGKNLIKMLGENGFEVGAYGIVPDRETAIKGTLIEWVDKRHIDLIVTTGGTGVSPTDVTPEATMEVIDKQVPGISEIMRQAAFQLTARAMLSRGIAGIRKTSLIVNLPGSERGSRENLLTVLTALPHALAKINGDTDDCGY